MSKELKVRHGKQSSYNNMSSSQKDENTLFFTEEKDTWLPDEEKRGRLYKGQVMGGMGLPQPFGDNDDVLTIVEDPDTHVKEIAWKKGANTRITAVELTVDDWVNNEQTVEIEKLKAVHHVWDSPAEEHSENYEANGVRVKEYANGEITFECDTTPTTPMWVSVIYGNETN